jgi:hypothetical protein
MISKDQTPITIVEVKHQISNPKFQCPNRLYHLGFIDWDLESQG